MHQLIRLAFTALFMLALSGAALAFTPDEAELSKRLNAAYGPLTSWEAEMTFPDHSGAKARIWYARGKWRQEWTAGDTAAAVGVGGSVVAACTAGDYALSPMFVWMVPNPIETWKSWGVSNSTASFGFCDGTPCYRFGVESDDQTLPAVHLNNEDMSPLLVRYLVDETLVSVRFGDYATLGGFQVPRSVTTVIGADDVIEARLAWKAVNQAKDEERFAREAFDDAPCASPPQPFGLLRDSFRLPVSE